MSEPNIRLPCLGDLLQKEDPLEHLAVKALKTSGVYFQEIQRAVEIEAPLLKGAHKISHAPGPRAEAVI